VISINSDDHEIKRDELEKLNKEIQQANERE
jgi:hypothetical protein